MKEEELGGLTQQDYKIISDHLTDEIFSSKAVNTAGILTEKQSAYI